MPYSKLDLGKQTTHEILNKVVEMFPTKTQKIKIDNQIPNEIIIVDETKFILALRNLLDNAIKYSKKNTDVKLIVRKNRNIEFEIKDKGIGVPKESIQELTKPFFQADQNVSTKGFGIGLTICKKIIEAHKGQILIESKEGTGSSFILSLPSN